MWYFIKNDEVVTCQVTDQWKHDKGLEVRYVASYIVSPYALAASAVKQV